MQFDGLQDAIPLAPAIVEYGERKLIGLGMRMSLSADRTVELFRTFGPRRREIVNIALPDTFCVKLLGSDAFRSMTAFTEFKKYAAVEVSELTGQPSDLDEITIHAGLHAVFIQKGMAGYADSMKMFFDEWLPSSGYEADDRPQFEILPPDYRETQIEQVWIPIRSSR